MTSPGSIASRLIVLLAFLGVATIGALYYYPQFFSAVPEEVRNLLPREQTVLEKTVSTPGPLRLPFAQTGNDLTPAGILAATNAQRGQHGQHTLQQDSLLDRAAQRKVDDMFAKQYFEHVSPTGVGPDDLVEGVGYEYIRVGENLALGNFASDAELVEAWMNSPGHRENILSPDFSEIGIAASKGTFEGHTTWLAVQTFALPLSACPTPEAKLEQQVDDSKSQLERFNHLLTEKAEQLAAEREKLDPLKQQVVDAYAASAAKVEEGNAQIERGNEVYKETGSREQAQPYWDRGEALQAEGAQLRKQAEAKEAEYLAAGNEYTELQAAYNNDIDRLKVLQQQTEALVNQLNQQIRKFNMCLR